MMTGETAVQAFDTVATLVVFVVIVYVVIEALEASPLGFESEIDDHIEDAASDAAGWV